MAQYIQVTGASFGNGHSDNPTYAFSVTPGDVYLSGSGGYVNAATGITKAELTSGVKLLLTSDVPNAVTCSVESGVTCADTISYATWIHPSPTATPTPTTTPPNASVLSLNVEDSVSGVTPIYRVTYNINGFKAASFEATSMAGVNEITLFITGTPNGTGTATVTRVYPDGIADEDGYVVATPVGCTVSPTGNQDFTSGDTISETFTITNFSHGDSIAFYVLESGEGPV
jgi:hypothetical protein